jgi:hypothetical protein
MLSRRLEDKNREKGKQKEQGRKRVESRNATKITESPMNLSPPTQSKTVTKKVAFTDPDLDKSDTEERTTNDVRNGRVLPYVDVPPLKATLRTPVIDRSKEDQTTKFGPAYKSRAPVEVGLDIERLVETVMDLEISIPLRSLAGVSNAVQKEIRKQVTKTRWPAEAEAKVNILTTEEAKPLIKVETLPMSSYMVMSEVSDEIPEGYLVGADPVLQFLSDNKDGEPRDLIVAKQFEPLRAIYMNINRMGQEECLLDDGSMIVSMSKEVATQLGLTWDPGLQINMESASKHVDRTLGLARNVRFAVGGLDFYLQVHILESPPYRVLLGRPFATLASCMHRTKPDGSSEVTLLDPNTKATATVPTYERGVSPEDLQKQRYQVF